MSEMNISALHGVVVEDQIEFTLVSLSRACHVDIEQLIVLVQEGALAPTGESYAQAHEHWRFPGSSLRRARAAIRLTRELELRAHDAALVLNLLDEIEALRSQIRRLGGQ